MKETQHEQTYIAKKYSLPNPRVYFRNNFFVSVSVVKNRQEAEAVLVRARKARHDAYIVSLSTWCRNLENKGKYLQCSLAEAQ